MAQPPQPPGRPGPEEADEPYLGSEAYEASVPTVLGGFRGTNPLAFVLGGAIAFAIIIVAFLAFVHRGTPQPRAATGTTVANQVPVAGGIGASPQQKPFIPEATFAPAPPLTAPPIFHIPLPARPLGTTPPSTPQPEQQVQPVAVAPLDDTRHAYAPTVPAPETNPAAAGDQMTIAQPSAPPQSAGQTQTRSVTRYVPVYRRGQLVAVVPMEQSEQESGSAGATPPAYVNRRASSGSATTGGTGTSGTTASQVDSQNTGAGGQFMSNQNSTLPQDSGLGSGNGGLLEARKYTRDTQNGNVGYAPTQSRRQLDTATVINARLLTKIESDLPGVVIGQVTQPVYDSATHTVVVVPSGSKVFGEYDEETVASSRRLLLAFNRIIFPDGHEFDIGGQIGTSADGTSGFSGDVDEHRGELYTSALLLTVLAGAESAVSPQTNNGVLTGQSISGQIQTAAGAELAQTANKVINRALDRPATIIIRPPYTFQIIVRRDLPLDEYELQHP